MINFLQEHWRSQLLSQDLHDAGRRLVLTPLKWQKVSDRDWVCEAEVAQDEDGVLACQLFADGIALDPSAVAAVGRDGNKTRVTIVVDVVKLWSCPTFLARK